MTEDGNRCTNATRYAVGKRCSYCEAVTEVVDAVTHDNHPRDGGDVVWNLFTSVVSVSMIIVSISLSVLCVFKFFIVSTSKRHQDLNLLIRCRGRLLVDSVDAVTLVFNKTL